MAPYTLFCMGNPLLDLQVADGDKILEKYDLKANDAILAESQHMPIYDEIVKDYKVTYVAGGAAQNTARGAAYILPPDSVVYTGCVGDDDAAEQMKIANAREGLHTAYQVKKGEQTGCCAVIITGHHRSLVTTLHAAEKYDKEYISSPAIAPLVDGAKFFYIGGYFLTHGSSIVLELAEKVFSADKTFALNISAPFIAQFFYDQLMQIIPYCDFIFGSEAEAEAWAMKTGHPSPKDVPTVAKSLAALPKKNIFRPRRVLITQGSLPTVLVSSDEPDNVKTFPVDRLTDEEIVDTNGAGDAFAGGFLAAVIAGKSVDDAVVVGHKLAQMCVKQIGPQYQWPKVKLL